ncbi:MAG TPA: carboxylating nicotinate-nucleotide diphosphorylase [Nitrososphaera sp.]|nr:carboxylating nicotinate-nucleotide diphosphorylase [Nitrososphaera sp.]
MQDLQTSLDVRKRLTEFLQEDIGAGDLTSESIVPEDLAAVAEIICKSKSPAVVSGLEEAAIVFDICGCAAKVLKRDGSKVEKGTAVMSVSGRARAILKAERTALNLIMRMSGISTETERLVNAAGGAKILATRKTAPGLRYFDKKAVILGGGQSHRMGLDDMVLIKDNHLRIGGSPGKCVTEARKRAGHSATIECEATNKAETIEAVSAGADIVMLDNFTPSQAKSTIEALSRMGLRKKAKIEISGGVRLENIRQYARAKPDSISLGYITHSPRAIDFSLEIKSAV